MPTEVRSPISRKGSKVGSITRAESPGALRRGDQSGEQPAGLTVRHHPGDEEHPASVQVTGPGPRAD